MTQHSRFMLIEQKNRQSVKHVHRLQLIYLMPKQQDCMTQHNRFTLTEQKNRQKSKDSSRLLQTSSTLEQRRSLMKLKLPISLNLFRNVRVCMTELCAATLLHWIKSNRKNSRAQNLPREMVQRQTSEICLTLPCLRLENSTNGIKSIKSIMLNATANPLCRKPNF